jgi:hypothetical protein
VPTWRSCGSIAPRLSTTSKRPLRAWAMYMFMRTWLRELNKSLHRVEIVGYDVLGQRATQYSTTSSNI